MKFFIAATIISLCVTTFAIGKNDCILINAKINGYPVKLALDTGTDGPLLFKNSAQKINLKIQKPISSTPVEPGKVRVVPTEKCTLEILGKESTLPFAVIDIPTYIKNDWDGVLGWGGLKHTILEIDPSSRSIKIHDNLTFDKSEWQCLEIRKDLNILVIKFPNEESTQDFLMVDTGSFDGLSVRKELWQKWIGDTTDPNTTLMATYTPGVGLSVDKEKWLKKINFSGLMFNDIPLETGLESNQSLMKEGIDAIVGMQALSCYSWIVDGPEGKIYLKQNDLTRLPEKYEYNRLGAVFVPENIQTSNSLIAHVVEGGPAYQAGIRNGDKLLKIGSLDVTKWRTDPNVMPLSRFWDMPAGTTLDLGLMQADKERNISVTLKEIFKED